MGIFDFFKKKNITNGEVINYYENGKIKERYNVFGGKKFGIYESYYENGKLKYKGKYHSDKPEGIHQAFNISGSIEEEKNYEEVQKSQILNTNTESIQKIVKSNNIEDDIDGEKLYTFLKGQKYIVNGIENIRKIKELNDPNKNEISSLFDLEEYYANGNIKKKTKKYTENNLYFEVFYDETGSKIKENNYLINENRLADEYIYEDNENYQCKHHYEGGEIRKSFYVDGLQDGIEKVFDKDGNLIEEHTYKSGRNTYYKRFIDGKVSKEYAVEDELNKEEEEIMRIAKIIETSSDFVSLVELLPADLSEYEGDTFYDVSEEFRVLLKNGKEVASGFIYISHNVNYWDDDDESHDDIQQHNEVMIVNGKPFTDYDDAKWGEQRRIATFWDDGEAEEFFKEYVKIKCKS